MRADTDPDVPIHIAAEAACWIARLHGPDRSRQMERDCLHWQARSKVHRLAFERCTATWDEVRSVSHVTEQLSESAAAAQAAALVERWMRASRQPGQA